MIISKHIKGKGMSAFAQFAMKPNDTVYDFSSSLNMHKRSRFTIESDFGHHLDKDIMFINHSCNPNCAIDRTNAKIYALKHIQQGDEITFDYKHNETEIANPFDCLCGSVACRGKVF